VTDDDLQFLVDAVLSLEATADRRTLTVPKFRGSDTRRGPHTVTIDDSGMQVWPTLEPAAHHRDGEIGTLSSGVDELDSCGRRAVDRHYFVFNWADRRR